MDGANDIPGIIGRAQKFDDDSQCIVFAPVDGAGGNYTVGMDSTFTVSLWVKADTVPDSVQCVFSSDDAGYGILLDTASRWVVYGTAPGFGADSCFAPAVAGEWVHLCTVRRSGWNYLYVNGTPADSCRVAVSGESGTAAGTTFRIGSFAEQAGWFTGVIDEVRICTGALSATLIRLCYETQREGQAAVSVKQPHLQDN